MATSRHPRARGSLVALQSALLAASLLLTLPAAAAAKDPVAAPPVAAAAGGPRMDPIAHLPQNPRSAVVHGPADMLGARARGLEQAGERGGGRPARDGTAGAASGIAAAFQFSGQVVDQRGVGFQASVFIKGVPSGTYHGGWTNADGTFSFPLDTGEYTVRVDDLNNNPYGAWGPAGFAYLTGATDHLVIGASDVTDARIVVQDAIVLSGKVTGNGSNLAGIEVDVFLEAALAGVAITGTDGTWAVPVRPGAYTIGYYTGGTTFGDGWQGTSGFVPNYAAAKVFAVGTSDVAVGTTALPATLTVSGKVVDNYSQGIGAATVEAWVNDAFYAYVISGSAGAFSIKVPPGNVKLWMFDNDALFAPGWRTSTGLTSNPASAAVTAVTTASVSGITIKSRDAYYLQGRIQWECDGCSTSGPNLWVEADAYGLAASYGVTNSNGDYYLPVLGGTYKVWADSRTTPYLELAGGYYRAGSAITPDSALATSVTVTSANATANILGIPSHSVTGIAFDLHGWELRNIEVQAFANGHFYTATTADESGVFHLDVLEGTYTLAFVDLEGGYVTGWLGESGWVGSFASAKSVVVTDDSFEDIRNVPMSAPPAVPTGVTAMPYNLSAGVSWAAVAATPNRPIIHYTAIASPGGNRCIAIGATSCTITGLTNGQAYTFRVTAASTVGTSALSAASGSVQSKPVPDAPGSVAGVATGTSLAVTWAAPAPNGSAITGYVATATPGGRTCSTSGATGCTITAMPDGLYKVSVVASNAFGAGPPGTSASIRVDVTAPTAGAPSAQALVGSVNGSTVSVKLSWTGSDAGSGISHYEVWQQTNAGAWKLIGSPTSATLNRSVTPSSTTTQRFRVRAFDKKGNVSPFAYGPTIKVRRVQQTATSSLVYSSGWTTSSTTSASGGSYRHTSTTSKSVSFTFKGRSISVVAHKSSSLGSFKVYIDGVYKATVSQYATSTQWQRVLYSLNVSSGTHTIKLVCVGTSGHPRISLDAFLVIQ